MRLLFLALLFFITFIGCSQDDSSSNLPLYSFSNDFEVQGVNELIVADNSLWSHVQIQNPTGKVNEYEVVDSQSSKGDKSLRLFSNKSNSVLSKIDIEKSGFTAYQGNRVIIEADFYLNSEEDLQDLFLLDLECCDCWDASVPDNQCPGIRLKLSGAENRLSIERGKILGNSIHSSSVFPRKQWVSLKWEMVLSPNDDGQNKVYLDDELVISSADYNMPNADSFRQEFANHGIDFELNEPTAYERFQIGATANPSPNDVELFIDNVNMRILPN